MEDIPLLEFDEDRLALIEPSHFHQSNILPEHCVLPFYHSVIEKLIAEDRAKNIYGLSTSGVSLVTVNIYQIEFEGNSVAIAFPGLGAPFSAAILEELIALGCRKFVACGSGGVLMCTNPKSRHFRFLDSLILFWIRPPE